MGCYKKMRLKFKYWVKSIKQVKGELLLSIFFLLISTALFLLSANYVNNRARTVISPDLILDHFGPYNLSFLYIWLFLLVTFLILFYPLIFRPKELPYVLILYSLFVAVRSGFVIFTHLGLPADAVTINLPWFANWLSSTNDLFFSGHAGLPFLGFLMFMKESRKLAYFMLVCSLVLGATVLLMHEHYSIDVFSAYFITYGIFVIGNKLVKR